MNVDETCLRILKNGSDKEACALLLEFTAKVTESIVCCNIHADDSPCHIKMS